MGADEPRGGAAYREKCRARAEAHVAVLRREMELPGNPSAMAAWARAYQVANAVRWRDGISDAEWQHLWPIMVEELRRMKRDREFDGIVIL